MRVHDRHPTYEVGPEDTLHAEHSDGRVTLSISGRVEFDIPADPVHLEAVLRFARLFEEACEARAAAEGSMARAWAGAAGLVPAGEAGP